MGEFIADKVLKKLVIAGKNPIESKVVILGLTFKEHTPDTRNSKVEDIVIRLREHSIDSVIVDPWANSEDAMREYNVELTELSDVQDADGVILAVGHNEFKALSLEDFDSLYKHDIPNEEKIIIDVKSILDKDLYVENNYAYWRL
ncbi:UDP binding domain-containing protein [Aerococcus urinaeequi]|uniref:UDP binding domain-containing protein n=1 Tax=Aerococcus urinaeequi TaxID=51665 RepID=UPI003D6BB75D